MPALPATCLTATSRIRSATRSGRSRARSPGAPAGGHARRALRRGRNFLASAPTWRTPSVPRAAAANLLVRRARVRAARRLPSRACAPPRTPTSAGGCRSSAGARAARGRGRRARLPATIRELRRQWRGYAAGRPGWPTATLAFGRSPRSSARCAATQARPLGPALPAPRPRGASTVRPGRLEQAEFLALDALLAIEELIGLRLGNEPAAARCRADPRRPRRPVRLHASVRPCARFRARARRREGSPDHQRVRLRLGAARPTDTSCCGASTGTRPEAPDLGCASSASCSSTSLTCSAIAGWRVRPTSSTSSGRRCRRLTGFCSRAVRSC